ncbi:fumarate hydratase [Pyrococcus yayanosii]|uniref:Fumarate hydratase n=1 Tax=Pyrococcus yayanosii (strain CH1 / JCM 16557) TaxID=529709 RepID=F8AIJ2_PYRYC|nr:fumarate hydratase [Pyrococcus yayanosii]AEH24358.1 fumarate hydratase [Pyrococcus yayanosii CH1]
MELVDALVEAIRLAVTKIPDDVEKALTRAYEKEENDIAKFNISLILKAIKIGQEKRVPVCQDTGTPTFFVELGDYSNPGELVKAIKEAVRITTEDVPLRPNALNVLTNENLGNLPIIHMETTEEKATRIAVLMKGGGSENCSALAMLTPAEGLDGLKRFVIEKVAECGGKPCPPIILGIGVGGTAEKAMELAKRALLRRIGERNPNPQLAALEEELLKAVNSLGIGPMGLGGKTTALDVKVEVAPRHPASFPVALAVQCWAHRRAFVEIKGGRVRVWQ